MADIQEYLDKIATARYGKDVRSSIVNAIKQNYDYSNGKVIESFRFPAGVVQERISNDYLNESGNSIVYPNPVYRIGPISYDSNVFYKVIAKSSALAPSVLFYDSGMNVIGHIQYNDTIEHTISNIPLETKYIIVQSIYSHIVFSSTAKYLGDIVNRIDEIQQEIQYPTKISGVLRIYENDYYYNDSTETVHDKKGTLNTGVVYVEGVNTVYYSGEGLYNAKSVIFLDSNFAAISSANYSTERGVFIPISVPNNAAYAIFQTYRSKKDYLSVYFDTVSYTGNVYKDINDIVLQYQSSPLFGKKYAVCGDSFTHGTWSGDGDTYADIIANKNHMILTNLSRSGMSLTSRKPDNSFTSQKIYQNIPADTDYITIMLGLNDGTATEGTRDSTDISTIWGAWNTALTWIVTNRPSAHIGIIFPYSWAKESWVDLYKEIGKYYGIPVLDLLSDPNSPYLFGSRPYDISPATKSARTKILMQSSDNHPTPAAHAYMAPLIQSFMERL